MVFSCPKLYLCKKKSSKSLCQSQRNRLRCVLCVDQLLHELFTTSFLLDRCVLLPAHFAKTETQPWFNGVGSLLNFRMLHLARSSCHMSTISGLRLMNIHCSVILLTQNPGGKQAPDSVFCQRPASFKNPVIVSLIASRLDKKRTIKQDPHNDMRLAAVENSSGSAVLAASHLRMTYLISVLLKPCACRPSRRLHPPQTAPSPSCD